MTNDEKKTWYLKRKDCTEKIAVCEGSYKKRRLETDHSTVRTSGNERRKRIVWTPFSQYFKERKDVSKTEAVVLKEFQRECLEDGKLVMQA
jgi:hypothetical protein